MNNWQYTPYTAFLLLSGIIALALAAYAWRQRTITGAKILSLLMLLVAIWSLGYALELASVSLSSKLFWAKIQYLGIAYTPAAWLYLALQYTGQEKHLTQFKHGLKLLILGPTVTAVLTWFNEWHHLIWATTQLDSNSSFTTLTLTYGPWFWVNVLFSYTSLLLGAVILLHSFLRTHSLYKRQVGILLIAAIIPWVSNALYLTNLNPFPNLDLTPFAFTLTGLITASGMFRFRLLDIVPVAHDKVIKGMHDGLIILDAQDRIIDMNPAAEKIIQKEVKEIIGQPIAHVLPQCMLSSNSFNHTHETITEIVFNLNGNDHYYEGQFIKILDKQKRATGQFIVLHDITERKQSEDALQKAKEDAETAVKTKTSFLNTMSHEIRTPLNAVIGMAELLRNTALTSEQQEFVGTIYTSSDTLLGIINNILDFSKIDAGKIELENEPFDLRDCIEASISLISLKVNTHAVKTAYYLSEQTPNAFNGDVVRLRQILVNLLGNAAKFTEEGQISVHVNSEPINNDLYRLHFAVKDTGIGIPADQIDHLFQSFTQVDVSTTRKYGGTGLGLAISKKLSQLMGGDIWIESELGVGSTFHFTIIAAKTTQQPERLLHPEQPRLRGKRLLIIVDNVNDRKTISRETRSWGMTPYVASSGPEALYWLNKSEPYDLALLDQTILDNEGSTFPEQILQTQKQHLPLILLSANPQTPNKQHAFAGHLNKPFTPTQLNNTLANIFSTIPKSLQKRTNAKMGKTHPLRILLAEDNLINQKVATRFLEKLDYQPIIANNGLEAINILKEEIFDVVFMDIQMPIMDGVEAAQQIRKEWPPQQQPRIIAMTAHALEGDREFYLSQGMDDYISKPIQIKNLVESLYKCTPIQQPTKPNQKIPPDLNQNSFPPIDMETAESLLGPEAAQLLADLLPIFLQDVEPILIKAEQAVASRDTNQLKIVMHTLKGNSASLGMNTLAALCQKMEHVANSNDFDNAENYLSQIKSEYSRIELAAARMARSV